MSRKVSLPSLKCETTLPGVCTYASHCDSKGREASRNSSRCYSYYSSPSARSFQNHDQPPARSPNAHTLRNADVAMRPPRRGCRDAEGDATRKSRRRVRDVRGSRRGSSRRGCGDAALCRSADRRCTPRPMPPPHIRSSSTLQPPSLPPLYTAAAAMPLAARSSAPSCRRMPTPTPHTQQPCPARHPPQSQARVPKETLRR